MIRNPRLAPLVGAGITLITAGTVFLAGAMSFSPGSAGSDILRAVGPEGSDGRSLVLPVDTSSGDVGSAAASSADVATTATAVAPADGSLVAIIPVVGDTTTEVAAPSPDIAGPAQRDALTARSLQPTSGRLAFRASTEGGARRADAVDTKSDKVRDKDKDKGKNKDGKKGKKDRKAKDGDRSKGRGDHARRSSRSRGKGASNSKGPSAKPAKPAKAAHSNKPAHAGPPAHSNAGGNGKGKGKGKG